MPVHTDHREVENTPSDLQLCNGSRVAVIGGGPAGSLFSYFLLDMAERADLDVQVDIYEPRDFSRPGPAGCNMCGGIVSEALVQAFATEGINLPSTVVQRGIDSYVLHTDEASVRINSPLEEKRIAAVHRVGGPRGIKERKWRSFDGFLLGLTVKKGAQLMLSRVEGISWLDGRPQVKPRTGEARTYDLLVVAAGVNSAVPRMIEGLDLNYRPPRTTKTYISEFYLGQETVEEHFGSAVHIFLLNMPRLEFAAIIPKSDYVTMCLLGRDIDNRLVQSFIESDAVKRCFPPGWQPPEDHCRCSPRMYVGPCVQPFADRMVFVGDCGVSRLYKDGIGAAYRTAKAAARTAVFTGISKSDFQRQYWSICRAICADNRIGEGIFAFTRLIQRMRCARRGVLSMVSGERTKKGSRRRMSTVLWDMFTGSAPYGEVLLRMLHPVFLFRLVGNVVAGIWALTRGTPFKIGIEGPESLGKVYAGGEVIVRQGEAGDCMYVIQSGQVEVINDQGKEEIHLAFLEEGDFFGEMALFEREVRSATVRARGEVRVLTVDKKAFLSRISEDPSLALRIVQRMSSRIREMNSELSRMKAGR